MAAITLTADWRLTAGMPQVRAEILAGMRALGFTVTSEMTTIVEAQRGSALSGGLTAGKAPLAATVWLSPGDPVCGARLQLADRGVSAASLGMSTTMEAAFREILGVLDQRLTALDPSAAPFPNATLWTRTGGNAPFVRAQAPQQQAGPMAAGPMAGGPPPGAAGFLGQAGAGGIGAALLGGRARAAAQATTPTAWSHVGEVTFVHGEDQARVSVDEVRAFLVIAAMIASQPKALPPERAAEVAAFAGAVEMGIAQAPYGVATVPVPEDRHVQTLLFLVRQARIRAGLPARILRTCVDCGQSKVMNPEFQAKQDREKRLNDFMNVGNAVFGSSRKSMFRIGSSLVRAGQHSADFVCPRCQCMKPPREQPVTFCPNDGCGDMRKEAVLLKCPKCTYDFRSTLPKIQLWSKGAPALPPQPVPPDVFAAPTMTTAPPPAAVPPMAAPPLAVPPAAFAPQAPGPTGAPPPPGYHPPTGLPPTPPAPPLPLPPPPVPLGAPGPMAGPPVLPSVVPSSSLPGGGPIRAPGGGKVCQICGRTFPTLWLVEVSHPGNVVHPTYVCATNPQCSPPSASPPQPV